MDSLQVERADGVVTVTLNRPEKKNAIDLAMWQDCWRRSATLALTVVGAAS